MDVTWHDVCMKASTDIIVTHMRTEADTHAPPIHQPTHSPSHPYQATPTSTPASIRTYSHLPTSTYTPTRFPDSTLTHHIHSRHRRHAASRVHTRLLLSSRPDPVRTAWRSIEGRWKPSVNGRELTAAVYGSHLWYTQGTKEGPTKLMKIPANVPFICLEISSCLGA